MRRQTTGYSADPGAVPGSSTTSFVAEPFGLFLIYAIKKNDYLRVVVILMVVEFSEVFISGSCIIFLFRNYLYSNVKICLCQCFLARLLGKKYHTR